MAGISQIVIPLQEVAFLPDAATQESLARLPAATPFAQALEWTFYVVWGTGVSVGVVKIESSWSPDQAGTWPAEATVTFAGTAPNQQVVHLTALTAAWRARISTTVSGGTVKLYVMAANKT